MDLIQGSVSVLNDSKFYLENLSSADYTMQIELMSNATIGQHTRHFIEFFQCMLSQVNDEAINYCQRKRDLNIEQNPEIAIQAIDDVISKLDDLDLEQPIHLCTSKEGTDSLVSSVAREIHYNIEHCIHHLALIKIGLKIIKPDLEIPANFGVAPSTIQYRKALAS